jgi:hypothetical protein
MQTAGGILQIGLPAKISHQPESETLSVVTTPYCFALSSTLPGKLVKFARAASHPPNLLSNARPRLYSSAHFNDTFPQHTPPEILNSPLEGVVLALRALGVGRPAGFPFPSAPEPQALAAAERCLLALSGGLGRPGFAGLVWFLSRTV